MIFNLLCPSRRQTSAEKQRNRETGGAGCIASDSIDAGYLAAKTGTSQRLKRWGPGASPSVAALEVGSDTEKRDAIQKEPNAGKTSLHPPSLAKTSVPETRRRGFNTPIPCYELSTAWEPTSKKEGT